MTAADMTKAGADITIPNFTHEALWDVLANRQLPSV
jgi:hypothetical protein